MNILNRNEPVWQGFAIELVRVVEESVALVLFLACVFFQRLSVMRETRVQLSLAAFHPALSSNMQIAEETFHCHDVPEDIELDPRSASIAVSEASQLSPQVCLLPCVF